MDVEYLRAQFVESVQAMFEENYVDDYFKLLDLEHGVADSPGIAPDCIRSFFVDAEKHMDEIEAALRRLPVDFKQITLGMVRIMRKTAWTVSPGLVLRIVGDGDDRICFRSMNSYTMIVAANDRDPMKTRRT